MQAEGIFADEFRAPGSQVALEVPRGSMAAVSGGASALYPIPCAPVFSSTGVTSLGEDTRPSRQWRGKIRAPVSDEYAR